jgi:hypothetical protein
MKTQHINKIICLFALCLSLLSCDADLNALRTLNLFEFNTNVKSTYDHSEFINIQNQNDMFTADGFSHQQTQQSSSNIEVNLIDDSSKFETKDGVSETEISELIKVAERRSEMYEKKLPVLTRFTSDQAAILESIIEVEVESYLSKYK